MECVLVLMRIRPRSRFHLPNEVLNKHFKESVLHTVRRGYLLHVHYKHIVKYCTNITIISIINYCKCFVLAFRQFRELYVMK